MDRNAPGGADRHRAVRLRRQSKALIERWHGRGRLGYAVTPRFAPTSTPAQLDAAGALLREHPGVCAADAPRRESRRDRLGRASCSRARATTSTSTRDTASSAAAASSATASTWPRTRGSACTRPAPRSRIARPRTPSSAAGCSACARRAARRDRCTWVSPPTSAAARRCRCWRRWAKRTRSRGWPARRSTPPSFCGSPPRGAAQALDLDGVIGTLAPGADADIAVLDLGATPLLRFRMPFCRDVHEQLAVLTLAGDDRAVRATSGRAGAASTTATGPRPGRAGGQGGRAALR